MEFMMNKLATEHGCKLDCTYDSGDINRSKLKDGFSEDMLEAIALREYLMVENLLFPYPSENWQIGVGTM
jgi:hypothetical protein